MSDKTLFEKIVNDEIPSFKVWEDETYLAFLTPFPNTLGLTVVIPKKNVSDYIFAMDDDAISGLIHASKKVAKLLERAFGVTKVAMVFEGEGVPHVHAKLYPMHDLNGDRDKFPKHVTFYPAYPGYISTGEGPRMSDEELKEIQDKIKKAIDEN